MRQKNQNLGILNDDHNPELRTLIDAYDQILPENRGEGKIRRQPPAPRPQEIIGDMIILLTLTGHLSCLNYHTAILSC